MNTIINNICKVFKVNKNKIKNIFPLNKGMTNNSYKFELNGKLYVYRENCKNLKINRKNEIELYKNLNDKNFIDKIIEINYDFKISEYVKSEYFSVYDDEHIKLALDSLNKFHKSNIEVDYRFDLKKELMKYEQLCENATKDKNYKELRDKIDYIISYIDSLDLPEVTCHIDFVKDNLLLNDSRVKLIDFEYIGKQNKNIDIAMFLIYQNLNKKRIDEIIELYDKSSKLIIYAYMAVCSLIWYNWCLAKNTKKTYTQLQLNYAKYFSKLVINEIKHKNTNAIILCAGLGSRLLPYTEKCHKSLLKIKNQPILLQNIKTLNNNGINDITIVTGYRAKDILKYQKKYNFKTIHNQFYDTTNNSFSLKLAKNKMLSNTIIMDGDTLIPKNFYIPKTDTSYYIGRRPNKIEKTEWLLKFNKNKLIESIEIDKKNLTDNSLYLMSFSYWTKKDCEFIKNNLVNLKDMDFWDKILFEKKFYKKVKVIENNEFIEIDTIRDYEKNR